MQVSKGSDQNEQINSGETIFPLRICFFRLSRAVNPIVGGPKWPKFELLLDILYVQDTYKYKKDRIKSNRERSGIIGFYMLKGS